jgi:hypothetical protein
MAMSGPLQRLWQQARQRNAAVALMQALPWAITIGGLAAMWFGAGTGLGVWTATLIASAAWAWRAWHRLDGAWLVRTLNSDAALQDSADLLLVPAQSLNPLQQRQRSRLEQALAQRANPLPVKPRWRGLALSWLACAVLVLLSLLAAGWLLSDLYGEQDDEATPTTAARTATAYIPVLRESTLQITAPRYTAQPMREQDVLEANAPQGSTLQWKLQFAPQPQNVTLQFHDGRKLPLTRVDDHWQAQLVLEKSALYRVVTSPAFSNAPLYRLDAVSDLPPQVQVLQPEQTLSAGQLRQRQWQLQFEATDDYAVANNAQLRVTVAQGSGENITFREQQLTLAGSGSARQRRFARTLDLAALGVGPGDDVIAQLSVQDNRQPTAQNTQSASLILRMPSEAQQQSADLEGAIKKVMPAYFRSQRQIIIDAEALLKQRGKIAEDEFVKRSDAIGVDQRILRLRYGQFLGEEAEGGAKPPPTSDLPTSDAAPTAADDGHAHADDHAHGNEAGPEPTPVFGSATDVLSEYGHTHDHAEAATLLDPQTRATLKAALDQMWSSEGHLRQGEPEKALPYAYKALAFIKQVQQAERIYLARLGPELPPIDPTRRMGGKRDGIASRRLAAPAVGEPDARAQQVWQQLGQAHVTPDLSALTAWLAQHERELEDPLALAAAIEELRAAPDCVPCRQRLRAALWVGLSRPAATVQRRSSPDATGKRYLEALQEPRP